MPLSRIETADDQGAWGLWHITEEEPDLSYLSFETCPEEIVHPQKRLEYLAGRALMRTLVEAVRLPYEGIRKDEYGKPHLKHHPHAISLSHSYPYVAAQIDRHHPVGIDVEQIREKLKQVGPRVLSPEEVADADGSLIKLCVYWCAKEALYKIHGKRNILFSNHLLVSPFALAESGTLFARIDAEGSDRRVRLGYHITNAFVLVYTDTKKS